MKIVYLSHPYTGNESINKGDARETCAQLKIEHPDWCIINPLDNFGWAYYAKLSYEKILEMCIALLACCDAIYMRCGWEKSRGCREEKKVAETWGLEVIEE